tara:strand:- start:286 stop:585 length:300 start_codon:yes stop_codon:yes gene_type:complete
VTLDNRLRNALVLAGILATSDIVQGYVMTTFGKSDGTFKGFINAMTVPSFAEGTKLIMLALSSSIIVGLTVEHIKARFDLEECADLDDALREIGEALEA